MLCKIAIEHLSKGLKGILVILEIIFQLANNICNLGNCWYMGIIEIAA